MKKKIDWQIEFDNFIEKNRFKGFKWGSWDCCKFSNACIKAMTDEDLIPKELKFSLLKSTNRVLWGKTTIDIPFDNF